MSTHGLASETVVIKNAEINLLDKLKDPDSAKFYDVRVVTNSQGKKAVCGLVNSKNSYGGYVGKQSFFSYESYTDIVDLDDSINTRHYKLSGCAGLELEKDAIAEDLATDGCLSNWDLIENTFINIDKVLNSQYLNADDVIKVNIWATEEIDWENVFDPIWDKFFGNTYPSMTIAYVRALGLPEIKIEIEILAAKV